MALPIGISFQSGFTLAATLVRLSDGFQWRQAATAGWFAAGTDTFANRKIALTEGTSDYIGLYKATTDVSGLGDAGFVRVIFHNDGASDQTIATVTVYIWGGNEITPADVLAISHDTTAADNAELMFDGTGYAGGTAKLGVDVVAISGDTTAANNAELMFDGTGYAGGTIKLGVDVVAISSDATAADNAEAFFDGTGYAGGTIPLGVNITAIAANAITASALATDAVTEIVAGVWNAAQSSYIASGSFGANLQVVRAGTATAGSLTTITLDAGASATDDFYNGMQIRLVGGTGVGEVNDITDYVGATKEASVAWATAPASGSQYIIEPSHETVIDATAVDAIWDIVIEAGAGAGNGTARALLAFAGAGAVAQLTGMGTTTGTLRAVDDAATTRATATIDQDGNRTAITVTAPT